MNTAIWERHARARIAAGDLYHPPGRPHFAWTRTGTGDPGAALLGDIANRRVVELGCGTGDNLAYLVSRRAARGVGIDASPAQIQRARARWPDLDFRAMGAARYLLAGNEPFDVCYSVFGAIGLTPTGPLLALIRRRLAPGGLLAFSVRTADHPQTSPAAPHGSIRWYLHPPARWVRLLSRTGFTDVHVVHADIDQPPEILIITAQAPAG